jgi:hypothetical protein
MRAILALGAVVVSTAALAQSGQNPPAGADNGFFRPTPGNDPSLHAPVVTAPMVQTEQPRPPAQPAPVPVYVPVQVATPPAVLEVSVPEAKAAQQAKAAEAELDRAQREAAEAQQRARQQPAPINGAFTGLTSERDR